MIETSTDEHYHIAGVQTVDDEAAQPRSFKLDVESGPTEMGFMVRVHSKPVNIIVEMDLDWDPEYLNGLIQCLPELIAHRMAIHEEESRSSTTAETVNPSISAQHGS